jgi:hypothetical protein
MSTPAYVSAGRPSSATSKPAAGSERRVPAELWWLIGAIVVFVAMTVWWLTQDDRVQDWDNGLHTLLAFGIHDQLAKGELTTWFTEFNTYPPLVHVVGALGVFVGGKSPMSVIIASNLIFVPLLAVSCYGVGRLAYGPRAGLLAGLFGLGTPMFVSMIHDFFIDTPQASMVAVSLWATLASNRFERRGVSILAGALCGLALLTKETSLVFLTGAVLAVIVRGGWRRPVGLLGFFAAFGVVAGPWYIYHVHDLIQTFTSIAQLYVNPVQSPPRWSLASFGWYFWNLVNEQAMLPFTVLFVIGVVMAIRRCIKDRFTSSSVLPEILAGLLVSYLGMTYLTHKDPRYTLPGLVYVAVLGTFWIPQIARPRVRVAVTVAFLAIAAINFVGMSTRLGGTRRIMISLPKAENTMIYQRQFTLYQNQGWLRGGPTTDGNARGLLEGLHQMGVTNVALDPANDLPDFSTLGYIVLTDQLDMTTDATPTQTNHSAYLFLKSPRPGDPPACQHLTGGWAMYIVRGTIAGLDTDTLNNPASPKTQYAFVCPGRPLLMYPAK